MKAVLLIKLACTVPLLLVLFPFYLYLLNYIHMFFFCDYAKPNEMQKFLNTMILTDVHILGDRHGHWLDKIIRETEMSVTFRVAKTTFKPDLIIFLGDLLDEGSIADSTQYAKYVDRFNLVFPMEKEQKRIIIPGNHDIGFHYHSSRCGRCRARFDKTFNTSIANLIEIKGVKFITINSMALLGDGCEMCSSLENALQNLAEKLPFEADNLPVILQHFPMYRLNDKMCNEPDSSTGKDRQKTYAPNVEVISSKATKYLLNLFRPRLSFAGHLHDGCVIDHYQTQEWTVASFNYRNQPKPGVLLLQISRNAHHISKCLMPPENIIFLTYFLVGVITIILFSKTMQKPHLKNEKKG